MWVIKIGGSLANSRDLDRWVSVIRSWRQVGLVIVPGGGPFADCVRAMQGPCGYDETTGHGMAVLAMEQYATLLAARCPSFVSCAGLKDISQTLKSGETALWRPHSMVSDADDITQTWDHTSDSLAAWLARRLKAKGVLLIKSRDPDGTGAPSLRHLQESDLIDRALGGYLNGTAIRLHCAGPDTLKNLRGGLRDWQHQGPGVPVDLHSER